MNSSTHLKLIEIFKSKWVRSMGAGLDEDVREWLQYLKNLGCSVELVTGPEQLAQQMVSAGSGEHEAGFTYHPVIDRHLESMLLRQKGRTRTFWAKDAHEDNTKHRLRDLEPQSKPSSTVSIWNPTGDGTIIFVPDDLAEKVLVLGDLP